MYRSGFEISDPQPINHLEESFNGLVKDLWTRLALPDVSSAEFKIDDGTFDQIFIFRGGQVTLFTPLEEITDSQEVEAGEIDFRRQLFDIDFTDRKLRFLAFRAKVNRQRYEMREFVGDSESSIADRTLEEWTRQIGSVDELDYKSKTAVNFVFGIIPRLETKDLIRPLIEEA